MTKITSAVDTRAVNTNALIQSTQHHLFVWRMSLNDFRLKVGYDTEGSFIGSGGSRPCVGFFSDFLLDPPAKQRAILAGPALDIEY